MSVSPEGSHVAMTTDSLHGNHRGWRSESDASSDAQHKRTRSQVFQRIQSINEQLRSIGDFDTPCGNAALLAEISSVSHGYRDSNVDDTSVGSDTDLTTGDDDVFG